MRRGWMGTTMVAGGALAALTGVLVPIIRRSRRNVLQRMLLRGRQVNFGRMVKTGRRMGRVVRNMR